MQVHRTQALPGRGIEQAELGRRGKVRGMRPVRLSVCTAACRKPREEGVRALSGKMQRLLWGANGHCHVWDAKELRLGLA